VGSRRLGGHERALGVGDPAHGEGRRGRHVGLGVPGVGHRHRCRLPRRQRGPDRQLPAFETVDSRGSVHPDVGDVETGEIEGEPFAVLGGGEIDGGGARDPVGSGVDPEVDRVVVDIDPRVAESGEVGVADAGVSQGAGGLGERRRCRPGRGGRGLARRCAARRGTGGGRHGRTPGARRRGESQDQQSGEGAGHTGTIGGGCRRGVRIILR
jgi:hypothetical protein